MGGGSLRRWKERRETREIGPLAFPSLPPRLAQAPSLQFTQPLLLLVTKFLLNIGRETLIQEIICLAQLQFPVIPCQVCQKATSPSPRRHFQLFVHRAIVTTRHQDASLSYWLVYLELRSKPVC